MNYKDDLDKNLIKANGLLSGLCLKNLDTLTDYNINFKLLSEESKFYIGICNQLLKLGYEVVDEVGFTSVVENFGLKDTYEKYGGWQTVKNLKSIVDERNADSIVDTFNKWNLVKLYNEKGILDLEKHYKKVEKMNSGQVADYIEYQINDIDININTDLQIVWSKAVKDFIVKNPNIYDPRKIIGSGKEAMQEKIREKIKLFGSNNKY